jgi:hypothetical protein
MCQRTPQIIDLGSELLVDRTRLHNPQARLVLAAIGQPLIAGSAWVAVDKRVASVYPQLLRLIAPRTNASPTLAA